MTGLLALAFTGGLLAPVNPCGFALLPAYLGHAATHQPDAPLPRRLTRALGVGAALAIGFALTLAAAGLAISAGAQQILRAAPWLGFGVGLLLAALGLAGLSGHSPRLGLRLRVPTLRRTGADTGAGRWALFGVGYAIASLACTFGVLLAVIAQAQATTGLPGQALVFAAYAAGSITLLLLLSAAAALAGAALIRAVRALARWQTRIVAALLLVTGAYVAVYWWPAVTGHSNTGHGLARIDHWSANLTSWLQQHTTAAATVAAVLLLAVLAAGMLTRARRQQPPPDTPAAGDATGGPTADDCCSPAEADTVHPRG